MNTKFKSFLLALVALLILATFAPLSAGASGTTDGVELVCCSPSLNGLVYGSANVNGVLDAGEWNLGAPFAAMYRAGNPKKDVLAYLYLKYNCSTHTMYALVKSVNGYPVQQDWSEAWIALGSLSNKVSFTQKAWLTTGDGWEVAFPLAEDEYSIMAHTNVNDGAWQTAGSEWTCLYVYCDPTAVELAGWSLSPGRGGVLIEWQTASEINNVGFNLYRNTANNPQGAVKINGEILPSQAIGSLAGASYAYTDTGATPWVTYYYWLEDIEVHSGQSVAGISLMHLHPLGQGSWNMPRALRVDPSSGSGPTNTSQRLTATYRDVDGDLALVQLWVNDSLSTGGVLVSYDVANNRMTLQGASGAASPGARVVLSNASGGLLVGASEITSRWEGRVLNVSWTLRFWKSFRGAKNIYIRAVDADGNDSGWQRVGSWTVQ